MENKLRKLIRTLIAEAEVKATKGNLKDFIRIKLEKDPVWMLNALLRIYDFQTNTEKSVGRTSMYNNVGFTGTDGEILSSFAEQLLRKKTKMGINIINASNVSNLRLSDKQMMLLANKMKKYWKQIYNISDKTKLLAAFEKYNQTL